MSEHTWRELERADMDAAAAHAVETENRAGQDNERMSELLPCPFCGGEAKPSGERFENTILSWVYCTSCGAAGGYRHTEAEAIAAWNSRATGGTLTAEQVMAIAGKHQPDYCSDTHVCFDWQAIADELNSRTERTCRVNELDSLTQTLSMANGCQWGECSTCGCLTPIDSVFCVECGAKVVGE